MEYRKINGQLVKVKGIIVVYGTPGKAPEVATPRANVQSRPLKFIKLGERLGREFGVQPLFQHNSAGYFLQYWPVSPVGSWHEFTLFALDL